MVILVEQTGTAFVEAEGAAIIGNANTAILTLSGDIISLTIPKLSCCGWFYNNDIRLTSASGTTITTSNDTITFEDGVTVSCRSNDDVAKERRLP